MTIGTLVSRVSFNCDGTSKVFPVTIQAYVATDFTVTLTAPVSAGGGQATLSLNSDYSLAASGSLQPTQWTLTTLAASAYATGYTLQVVCTPVMTQLAQFIQGQAFPSLTVQTAFDRLTQMVQRLEDQISRSIRAPDGDVSPLMLLPTASQRLNAALLTDGNGNITVGVPTTQNVTLGLLTSLLNLGPTSAETSAGVTIVNAAYPPGNVLRYGLVPNSVGAAANNTAILQTLFNPAIASGPVGAFNFPNTTGADVYSFNAPIVCRPGVYLNLNQCNLSFVVGSGDSANYSNSGCLFSLRDFGAENGTVTVAWSGSVSSSSGYAFMFGARGTDSALWAAAFPSGVYDSALTTPQGKIRLKNIHISVTNTGSNSLSAGGVQMTGGLRDVMFDNITINGNSTVGFGISYEFGWATFNAAQNLQQSSHMHDFKFTNLDIKSIAGTAVRLGGAYNGVVENLYASAVATAFQADPAEAMYYRPWAGVDDVGAKRSIVLRNVVGTGLTGTGISVSGAVLASGTYLAAIIAALGTQAQYAAQVDLLDVAIDGFALSGTVAGFGIACSAGKAIIRNGQLSGFQDGINCSAEATRPYIDNVTVIGCTRVGINLNSGGAIVSPSRFKTGHIRGCLIAGNSTASPNGSPGISGSNLNGFLIEENHLNYITAHDFQDETTQGNAVQLDSTCSNTVCRANNVGVVLGGSFAYDNTGGVNALNGLGIVDASGTVTFSGAWEYDGMSTTTATLIADKTSAVNTIGKYVGKRCYDSTNKRIMVCTATGATGPWNVVDASATVTPS